MTSLIVSVISLGAKEYGEPPEPTFKPRVSHLSRALAPCGKYAVGRYVPPVCRPVKQPIGWGGASTWYAP